MEKARAKAEVSIKIAMKKEDRMKTVKISRVINKINREMGLAMGMIMVEKMDKITKMTIPPTQRMIVKMIKEKERKKD